MRFCLTWAWLSLSPLFAAAQPKIDTPKNFPPDEATKKLILTKTSELAKVLEGEAVRKHDHYADVAIYLKAAQWIVKHDEFFTKDSAQQTVTVLNTGLERAKQLAAGKTPWLDVVGKPVVRGYISKVDRSIQPYTLMTPENLKDAETDVRLDVVLHGRDATLTEVKFLASAEKAKTIKDGPAVILEPYGRGNNAYRWAGETDVFEALSSAVWSAKLSPRVFGPKYRVGVLRGFSMGGAGTWHIGLHAPHRFRVLGPGAGFTTTHGYISNLPKELPDYQEKCLKIYDAVAVAENVYNIPVVAYSGEIDKQKAAADNIIAALKDFKKPYQLTHLIAPGLEHKMPPEWMAKAEAEYQKVLIAPSKKDSRYVLYTTGHESYGIGALEKMYQKAIFEEQSDSELRRISTQNIRAFQTRNHQNTIIDGQKIPLPKPLMASYFLKISGKWKLVDASEYSKAMRLIKSHDSQGPIDDMFRQSFYVNVCEMEKSPISQSVSASHQRMVNEWSKWMRGDLEIKSSPMPPRWMNPNSVVFGDYSSIELQEYLPDLPITWNAEKLIVNGVTYDSKTHYPVMIYPTSRGLIVLNSGHTFHDKEFQGSNALLYPRLGDWAVLKIAPTKDDPAHTETVAAGLFDENWQFAK